MIFDPSSQTFIFGVTPVINVSLSSHRYVRERTCVLGWRVCNGWVWTGSNPVMSLWLCIFYFVSFWVFVSYVNCSGIDFLLYLSVIYAFLLQICLVIICFFQLASNYLTLFILSKAFYIYACFLPDSCSMSFVFPVTVFCFFFFTLFAKYTYALKNIFFPYMFLSLLSSCFFFSSLRSFLYFDGFL